MKTKKFFILVFILILGATTVFSLNGCADNNVQPTPPATGGQTTIIPNSPSATTAASALPSEMPSEMPTASESPNISPNNTGSISGEIPDFMPGKVVDESDVPNIVTGVREKYPEATINSITHTMHLDKQVYEVILVDKDGETHTVYVSPDGGTVTEKQ